MYIDEGDKTMLNSNRMNYKPPSTREMIDKLQTRFNEDFMETSRKEMYPTRNSNTNLHTVNQVNLRKSLAPKDRYMPSQLSNTAKNIIINKYSSVPNSPTRGTTTMQTTASPLNRKMPWRSLYMDDVSPKASIKNIFMSTTSQKSITSNVNKARKLSPYDAKIVEDRKSTHNIYYTYSWSYNQSFW